MAEHDNSLAAILDRLANIERKVQTLEGTAASRMSAGTKRQSIKEFLLEKRPKDAVQTTLAVGYYIEHVDGISPFSVKDLAEGYRSARERLPANINDKINHCIKDGHMMPVKEKKDGHKAWVLTSSGERFVENGLKDVERS